MANPDLGLWRAVLAVGLQDAARDPEARVWMRSADFEVVCALAGLDALAVRERFDPSRFIKQARPSHR